MAHVPLPDWDWTVGNLLRVAQQVHVRLWTDLVGPDLTSPQYALLVVVSHEPGIDQRSAGERASLDKATIADMIARMVRHGWLRRARDPDDARRNLVSLTPAGWRVLREATPIIDEVQLRLATPVPADDFDVLLDLLRTITHVELAARTSGQVVEIVAGHHRFAIPELPAVLGHLIRRAQQAHERLWSHEIGGLTSSQTALLSATAEAPFSDQRSLGERAHLDKATGAEMIARMMRRSLVSRTRDVHDARRNLLTLTPAGEQALREVTPGIVRVESLLTESLTARQQDRFRHLLGAVARMPASAQPARLASASH
ncbi:MarR family winged helix-turn-helix transcriptional regulator [Tenggerimyces flavus]|uniref:MarR family winged helix-turn-helix transcriptional regulator n=1 Tax=Tenggerimyces flavus TaxID=1708749 RepID=A0ABV7YDW6_9ACTN|nr:MarR family transcriptional regulator [Tenggerimyces flavus]MBM7788007.1 DNA-binding MarR family transcriptional regulator [Tenggerimyces flavus]